MSVDKQQNNSVAVSEKRRKLLKASAITPLVATVTFGTGQAAAASAYQCMDDVNNSQPSPNTGDDIAHDDGLLVNTGDVHKGSDGVSRMLVDKFVHNPASPDIADSTLNLYDIDGVFYKSDGNSIIPDFADYDQAIDADVAMLYTPTGDLTGIISYGPWPQTRTERALFASCVNSIASLDANSLNRNIV